MGGRLYIRTNAEVKHQDSLSWARFHEELHFVIKQGYSSSAFLTWERRTRIGVILHRNTKRYSFKHKLYSRRKQINVFCSFIHLNWVILENLCTIFMTWVINSLQWRSREGDHDLLWQEQFDCPVAEQASCCRTNILSIGTHCSSRGFQTRTQRNIIMFAQRKEKKNQAPLALVLTFSHCCKASHSTLKNSWHKFLFYVDFAATSFHSNNLSYILLFYGMHASLPFLSKGIFYCRGGIMTV